MKDGQHDETRGSHSLSLKGWEKNQVFMASLNNSRMRAIWILRKPHSRGTLL